MVQVKRSKGSLYIEGGLGLSLLSQGSIWTIDLNQWLTRMSIISFKLGINFSKNPPQIGLKSPQIHSRLNCPNAESYFESKSEYSTIEEAALNMLWVHPVRLAYPQPHTHFSASSGLFRLFLATLVRGHTSCACLTYQRACRAQNRM